MPDRLLTVPEVAERLRVSTNTVRAWGSHATGPASFKLRGRRVYRESVVEAWVEEQEATQGRELTA